uniref:Uncharacterized protein n=1 Tax=Physcomitrium patens TaxID=3218 RepID=A0A7I4ALT6_PHYPA
MRADGRWQWGRRRVLSQGKRWREKALFILTILLLDEPCSQIDTSKLLHPRVEDFCAVNCWLGGGIVWPYCLHVLVLFH